MNSVLPVGIRIVCDFERGPLTMAEVESLRANPNLFECARLAERCVRSRERRTRLGGWVACHLRRIHAWEHGGLDDEGGVTYCCSRCGHTHYTPRYCHSHGTDCPNTPSK